MNEQERPLMEDEIDERVIAQVDDDDAWEDEIYGEDEPAEYFIFCCTFVTRPRL